VNNGIGGVCDVEDHVCRDIDGGNGDDARPACERMVVWAGRDSQSEAEILVSGVDGSGARALTDGPDVENYPSWSPDGTVIAYAVQGRVWLMNADGSDQHSITPGPGTDSVPRWSPNGDRIAFLHLDSGTSAVWSVNPDGSDAVPLTPAEVDPPFFDWSPDGSKMAFRTKRDGNFEVYVMQADGSSPTNLTNNPAADGGDEGDIQWSPDGDRIAFVSDMGSGAPDLWTMAASGVDFRDLNAVPSTLTFAGFDWSPDGSIFYGRFDGTGRGELRQMFGDGSGQHTVFDPTDPELSAVEPAVASDGVYIAWTGSVAEGGPLNLEVYTARIDGSDVVRISNRSGSDARISVRPCP
jgi:dipeptidyl aminopeptidase/acylaminoacyl peptidase